LEVKVIEKGDRLLEMEVRGIDFGILDSLQEILNSFTEVEYAGVNLTHPLIGAMRFLLKTREGFRAVDVLQKGLGELQRAIREIKESVESELS